MGEPRSWGEFTEELVRLIGQEADTGGSPTEGTLAAKGNAILKALENALQRGTVRNLQTGICAIDATDKVEVVLSGFTNVDKMLVFYNGALQMNSSTNVINAIVTELSTSYCIFRKYDNGSVRRHIHYQIVEFW